MTDVGFSFWTGLVQQMIKMVVYVVPLILVVLAYL